MFERFTHEARATVTRAADEARRRGDRRVGTDHLLIGVLGDLGVAQAARVDAGAAQRAVDALDRRALATIGVDVDGFVPVMPAPIDPHLSFSSGAREVLRDARTHRAAGAAKRIEADHLLLALLQREAPDPAAVLLDELGVDRAAASQRVAGATR